MGQIVIVEGLRTAVGRFGGTIKDFRAQDLGGFVVNAVMEKTGLDPELIDEVVMGNCHYNGYPGVARLSLFRAGLPHTIPAQTVERQCASGLLAVATASDHMQSGNAEVILAGGTEAMSNIPYYIEGARWGLRSGNKNFLDGFFEGSARTCGDADQWGLYLGERCSMGITAENVARKHNLTREQQDEFACESHLRAAKAIEEGKFKDEIVPVEVPQRKKAPIIFDTDEGVRADTTVEKLGKLAPAFVKGGTVTAGNSSPLNDGASCVLMMTEEKAKELGLKPRLKVVAYTAAGVHPAYMGLGPVPAIEKILKKTGLSLDDIDLIELNEAFAAQSLGVVKELGFTEDHLKRLNVNGGAIALGHALGNSGSRLVISLMSEMERRDVKRGLVSLCVGGGQGMAMMFER
ncbi:MAG: thiolase family protein [Deltaproteobacteria bacterium]|nr:thiolase family protein [Deltaproteobacteria bacterium]